MYLYIMCVCVCVCDTRFRRQVRESFGSEHASYKDFLGIMQSFAKVLISQNVFIWF